jgi:CrcB protein
VTQLLIIALGGAIGSICRFLVSLAISQRAQGSALMMGFPFATLLVNAVGSFLIGVAYLILQQRFADHDAYDLIRSFVIVGLLGGFTTFSAFSLETLHLFEYGLLGKAMLNIIASLTVCILAVFAGATLGRWIV